MAGIPYLPPGQSELPAERFILFVDTSNLVLRIDEAVVQKNLVSFTAEWQSGTLNQLNEGHVFSLAGLDLYYAAISATTLSISGSGDGGETWSTPQVIVLQGTPNRTERLRVDFDDVTGFDVRFRLQLDTDILANIYGYRPHLVDRGDLIF